MLVQLHQAIPEKTKERLIYLGNQQSDIQWEIADITNALIDLVATDPKVDANDMDIYSFVASLTGNGQSTIRYYAYTGRAYSHKERDKYYPALTFKHFHTAKQYGELKFKILDACMRYMDNHHGRRPSCDWITAHFQGISQAEKELDYEELTTYELTTPELQAHLQGTKTGTEGTPYNKVGVWKDILRASAYIRSRFDIADLEQERKDKLTRNLDEFEGEIRDLLTGAENGKAKKGSTEH